VATARYIAATALASNGQAHVQTGNTGQNNRGR
jgi:hypothetical protein